jgi:ABC-type Fe3+ transport system substrate-binding protein
MPVPPIAYRGLLAAALVTLAASPAFAQRGGRGEDGSAYGWYSDYAAAKAEAKKTGKPLMVVFRCIP